MGPGGFVVATLTLMGGVAAAPWLLPRVATAPGVYEARKSLGWATFIFGVVMLTVSAVAVFMRDAVMDVVLAGGDGAVAPPWLEQLIQLGFVEVDTRSARLAMTSVAVKRDAVLFSLPIAIGMPAVFFYLMLAGLRRCARRGERDGGCARQRARRGRRAALLGARPAGGEAHDRARRDRGGGRARRRHCGAAPTDPLRLLLWAFALTGAAAFPVLVLSVWWKRINAFGALAGMATGFAVTMLAIIAGRLAGSGSTARSPACSGCRSPRSPQGSSASSPPRRAATCSNCARHPRARRRDPL